MDAANPLYNIRNNNRSAGPQSGAGPKGDTMSPVNHQVDTANSSAAHDLDAIVVGAGFGFGFHESTVSAMSVSEEERQAVFQKAWDIGGGFRFMFGTFSDISTDEQANEAAASFVRNKIAEIVTDPETARKLTPSGYYAKRPLCDGGYYATFNRDNVELIDVKANPIAEITPRGVRTEDGIEHELDMLIFASGFDAVDGNYTKIDIRGRDNVSIKEHWNSGPTSYLGVTVSNFPNMFMVLGPDGPFTNLPPSIETQVEWISDTIGEVEQRGHRVIEATREAEQS